MWKGRRSFLVWLRYKTLPVNLLNISLFQELWEGLLLVLVALLDLIAADGFVEARGGSLARSGRVQKGSDLAFVEGKSRSNKSLKREGRFRRSLQVCLICNTQTPGTPEKRAIQRDGELRCS